MDSKEREGYEQEILEWASNNQNLNFQASPTKALQAVIHEAIMLGYRVAKQEASK